MKRRSKHFGVWLVAVVTVFVSLMLAQPAGASPIYSLRLSDGAHSDGADIVKFIDNSGSGGTFQELIGLLTPILEANVITDQIFDWMVLTKYDGGTASAPGAKLGEWQYGQVDFTSAIFKLKTSASLLPVEVVTFDAGGAHWVAEGTTGTPEPGTLALLGVGGLIALARRRRQVTAG
jgi:hypothetical protein